MKSFRNLQQNLNIQLGPVKIEKVLTKIGSVFGETGRKIGDKLDEVTNDSTINLFKYRK